MDEEEDDTLVSNSNNLNERIQRLISQGEEWRKYKQQPPLLQDEVGGVLSRRLKELETSQETWKKRVGFKDAELFTVNGKIQRELGGVSSSSSSTITDKQLIDKKKLKKAAVAVVDLGDNNDGDFTVAQKKKEEIKKRGEVVEINEDSFRELISLDRELLKGVKKVRRKKNVRAAGHTTTTTNSSSGFIIEEGGKISGSALDGLSSVEDYTSVKLKKTAAEEDDGGEQQELILVKGRRNVQVRRVRPAVTSLNPGDAFILICAKSGISWSFGAYANILEKSKTEELVNLLADERRKKRQQRRRGLVGVADMASLLLEEEETAVYVEKFEGLGDDLDEEFEAEVIGETLVWRVTGKGDVVLDRKLCGVLLDHSVLQRGEVLVFDFVSETYVWVGIGGGKVKVDAAVRFAREHVVRPEFNPEVKRISQFTEPVLFSAKFLNWKGPAAYYLSRNKNKKNNRLQTPSSSSSLPAVLPVVDLLKESEEEEGESGDLMLENFNVGVGVGIEYVDEDGRRYEISTGSVRKWHVTRDLRGKEEEFGEEEKCTFDRGGCYAVCWVYNVTYLTSPLFTLSSSSSTTDQAAQAQTIGAPFRGEVAAQTHAVPFRKGRDRTAWFFWYGAKCNKMQRGALGTIFSLEHSKHSGGGQQMVVEEGEEPRAFLSLFEGRMRVVEGQLPQPRVFVVLGERDLELHRVQVDPAATPYLRAQGVFTTTTTEQERVLWRGPKASPLHCASVASLEVSAEDEEKEQEEKQRNAMLKEAYSFSVVALKGGGRSVLRVTRVVGVDPFPLTQQGFMKLTGDLPWAVLLLTDDAGCFLCWRDTPGGQWDAFRHSVLASVNRYLETGGGGNRGSVVSSISSVDDDGNRVSVEGSSVDSSSSSVVSSRCTIVSSVEGLNSLAFLFPHWTPLLEEEGPHPLE